MHNREVLVSEEETSEAGEEIFKGLPPWMPRTESSGNFKLLDVVGRAVDRLKDDIEDADDATNIQTAQSIEQLEELSKLVDVSPKSGESVEKYRRRIIGEFQNTTNEADLAGLIENVSTLLEISTGEVKYSDGTENGAFILSVPGDSIGNASLTQAEFSEIIGKQAAAGFRADIQRRGTFTYLTPTEYDSGNHDTAKAYDGTDTDGNPKDNGGTYAGVLN